MTFTLNFTDVLTSKNGFENDYASGMSCWMANCFFICLFIFFFHFYKTDPSGVYFSRQWKVEVISCISAALETREKQNKNRGKQKGKRMPSASPLGSAEHRSKKHL